jgi:hypothetical protein
MTMLYCDSFDVYPNIAATSYGLQAKWVSAQRFEGENYLNLVLVTGRFGGQGLQMFIQGDGGPSAGYPFAPAGSGINSFNVRHAFRIDQGAQTQDFLHFRNNGVTGSTVLGLGFNSSQQLYLFEGTNYTTALATSLQTLTTGSWHFIETVVTTGATSSVAVYLDGLEVLTWTGGGANATVDTIEFGNYNAPVTGGQVGLCSVDDFILLNVATQMGERRVAAQYPASNGAVAWTPLANTNWQEVSETVCDGDATYVSTNVAATSDLYGITSLTTTPLVIEAVQVRCAVRKDDASSHILKTQIQSTPSGSSTVLQGANFAVTATYTYDTDIYATDPAGNPWTAATVNGAQIGQVLTS